MPHRECRIVPRNAHADGPKVYAHEIYTLRHAVPGTYQVVLNIYAASLSCDGTPIELETAQLSTNAAGNGPADAKFTPEDGGGLRGSTVSIMDRERTSDICHPVHDGDARLTGLEQRRACKPARRVVASTRHQTGLAYHGDDFLPRSAGRRDRPSRRCRAAAGEMP